MCFWQTKQICINSINNSCLDIFILSRPASNVPCSLFWCPVSQGPSRMSPHHFVCQVAYDESYYRQTSGLDRQVGLRSCQVARFGAGRLWHRDHADPGHQHHNMHRRRYAHGHASTCRYRWTVNRKFLVRFNSANKVYFIGYFGLTPVSTLNKTTRIVSSKYIMREI